MKKYTRKYPLFSACGLNCGLCPRYHTEGTSKCSGCAGKDFFEKRPSCGIISCSQKKELEYCYLCNEFPCKKYDKWDNDSFITHKNYMKDFEKIKRVGLEQYQVELEEKVRILEFLLNNYNDGRKKNFYCIAINLLELSDIKGIINIVEKEIKSQNIDLKDKIKKIVYLFEEKAKEQNVELNLRKSTQSLCSV